MPPTIEIPERLADEVILTRRDLHMHPELGFEEHRTASIVAARLRHLGYDGPRGHRPHRRGRRLARSKPGRTIMLRADMDALPILKRATYTYRSQFDGTHARVRPRRPRRDSARRRGADRRPQGRACRNALLGFPTGRGGPGRGARDDRGRSLRTLRDRTRLRTAPFVEISEWRVGFREGRCTRRAIRSRST